MAPIAPSNRDDRLWAAIQISDVIRRNEIDSHPINAAESTSSPSMSDPLHPLRMFLETPGVQQACMTAVVCVTLAIPVRRLILQRADKHWRLGTIFPDLVVTPTLTVAVAQCTLWAGSVYGSIFNLNRLVRNAAVASTLPSATLDSICTDPTVISAAHWETQQPSSSELSLNAWNPQAQAFVALKDALKACRERRDYNKNVTSDAFA